MEPIKELQLQFKTADGKQRNLTLESPSENLDEATVKTAMQAIVDAQAFEKASVAQYQTILGADYVERRVTSIFKKA